MSTLLPKGPTGMKTRLNLFPVLLLFASSALAANAGAIRIADYFMSHVGDTWSYKNNVKDGMSPISISVSKKAEFAGMSVFQREENNGDHRLQTIDAKGLLIHRLYFKGDRDIDYPAPMVLFPAIMKVGEKRLVIVPPELAYEGQVSEKGTQTYDSVLEAIETADTPLGRFADCAVIRTIALRTTADGTQKGYNLREWHAKGVGPVKIVGELYWILPGKPKRIFQIDATIESATVAGKPVTGPKP